MSNTNPPVPPSNPRHRAPTEPSAPARATRRGAVATAVIAGVVAVPPTAWALGGGLTDAGRPAPQAKVAKAPGELVDNGSFEDGLAGWKVNRAASQELARGNQSVSGDYSAKLRSTTGGSVVVNDDDPTIISTTAGLSYQVSAYVRATGEPVSGKIRIREVGGGASTKVSQQSFRASSDGWSRVSLTYTSETTGSKVDLNVVGRGLTVDDSLLVDDLSMVPTTTPGTPTATSSPSSSPSSSPTRTPSTSPTSSPTSSPTRTPTPTSSPTSSSPTSTPTSTPTTPPTSGCVSNQMGIPSTGKTFLGAAVSGGNTIEGREQQIGMTMRVHRTYYSAARIDAAVRTATEDVQAGRLPWISFKAPHSWAQMAAGAGDGWARDLADGLAKVPGPVWLAVHHEPEKDGDMSQWTQMQRQIAPVIHSRTDNVAYTVIYSGWNTFGGGTNTLASKWPGDQHIDVTAIDAYNDYGVTRSGRVGDKHLDLRSYYVKLAAWAEAHGTAWGVAETGQSIAGAKDEPDWVADAYRDMRELGGAALSYFDSNENSVSDWRLNDSVKRRAFTSVLPQSTRIC